MTDVRIVCAHDGQPIAQTLMRLLVAEQHVVELCYGRASLEHLDATQSAPKAVILIWSLDAPSALYMLTWLKGVDPTRLIEIACARRWPASPTRRGEVLDFSAWNGTRGGAAWRALTERLRAIGHALEPPRPPPLRAALALSAVSVLAVGAAIFERLHAPDAPAAPAQNAEALQSDAISMSDQEGRGGPLVVREPDSYIADEAVQFGHILHVGALEAPHAGPLIEPRPTPAMHFREASLLERIADLAPRSWDRRED